MSEEMFRWVKGIDGRVRELERTDRSYFSYRAQAALLGLPALRAAWPMSSVDFAAATRAKDVSGQGNHLGDAGPGANVEFAYDQNNLFAPIAVFNGGANDYLILADAGAGDWADIGLPDLYVRAAERGLTLGGWFWWSALPGAQEYLIAKDSPGVASQYFVRVSAANQIQFFVWPGAIGVTSAATIIAGWNHCVGIYDQPSQTVFVVLNGAVTIGAVGAAPAALIDTAQPFTIGADAVGANLFTGYASMCFLCASSVSQTGTRGLRQQQRNVFGV